MIPLHGWRRSDYRMGTEHTYITCEPEQFMSAPFREQRAVEAAQVDGMAHEMRRAYLS